MAGRNEFEQHALKIILSKGDEGLLQSELWRELNTNSRIGSRLAIKIEEKGLIQRKRELHNGRWTYRIFAKIRRVTVDSIVDVPCTSCPEISKCGFGGEINPESCQKLSLWLLSIADKQQSRAKDNA